MKTHLCLSIFTTLLITLATAQHASAFCGMYVSNKSDETLLNDATQVVLFREGIHTALTMRNSYKGPVEDFAMLVPVPQVLDKEHVHTVNPEYFQSITSYTLPRLVKYKQGSYCPAKRSKSKKKSADTGQLLSNIDSSSSRVTVVTEYDVAEYEIKILEAKDSSGLLTWLNDHKYKVPEGGEELLQGYINTGMYFFVAKINADKVTFEDGEAVLTPLKFSYTSEEFSLPVRLGLLNANGPQDLLIHIISDEGRFESSNYRTGIIPTNLIVDKKVEKGFASFYESLFSHVLKSQESQLITEFVGKVFWQKCDPCVYSQGTLPGAVFNAFASQVDFVVNSLDVNKLKASAYKTFDTQSVGEQLETTLKTCFDPRYSTTKFNRIHEGMIPCAGKYNASKGAWSVVCQGGTFSKKFRKKDTQALQRCISSKTEEVLGWSSFEKDADLSFELNYTVDKKVVRHHNPNLNRYVVTRLRGRFDAESSKEDIVFTKAAPLFGGYGMPDDKGKMTSFYTSDDTQQNRFQARYIILDYLNKKDRKKKCKNPSVFWTSPQTSASSNTLSQKASPKTFGKKQLKKLIKNEKDAKLNL